VGEKGGSRGDGGVMTQTLHAHINKREKKKNAHIKNKNKNNSCMGMLAHIYLQEKLIST
jgi:hypothetical protein